MADYYEYTTDFTVSVNEDLEIFEMMELEYHLKLTSPGRPAKLSGPPEDCYPAEYPEWELDDLFLRFTKTHKLKITEEDCVALFGRSFFDRHYDLAEDAANEEQE